jgi:DHA3 family macrolide efflux protein-like MFS transporter
MIKLNNLKSMRGFLLLWGSSAVSMVGSEMTNFALTVHVYEEQGTATSVALLRLFYFLPSILLCFAAGALADRIDKKKLMLAGVLAGGLATGAMLLLTGSGVLQIWHLYAINFAVSLVNAFVNPAVNVAVTLLSPREHAVRVSGMLLFSGSLSKIAGPILAAAVMSAGGLRTVFIADILSFAVAFLVLLLAVRIPPVPAGQAIKESFLKSCGTGLRYLRANKPIWKCILFLALINLLSSVSGDGSVMPSMVLARTGGSETALTVITSAVSFGTLVGSIAVTAAKRAKSRTRVMFLACAFSFLICNLSYGFGRGVPVWAVGAFLGWLLVPFITANNSAILRSTVPVELQGRVYAARDTVQYAPIPLGLYLGGFLADRAFEPLMRSASPLQQVLSVLVGTGKGSGMAVVMLITGLTGFAVSIKASRNPIYRQLD